MYLGMETKMTSIMFTFFEGKMKYLFRSRMWPYFMGFTKNVLRRLFADPYFLILVDAISRV